MTDQRLWRSLAALLNAARDEVSMAEVTASGVDGKHVGRIGVVSVAPGSGMVLNLSEGAKAESPGAFVEDLQGPRIGSKR